MRSTLSDDLQDIGWWLASDGKWYAPDLHPAARPVSAEQARIAALLDATIGVAQVRDKVFAQVHDQGRTGTAPSGDRDGAYPGTQYVSADDRSSGQGTGARHGSDLLPRFRRTDRPNWPFEAHSPSESVTQRPETRWRPDAQQRPDTRRPPSRTTSGPDRLAPAPRTLGQPPSAVPAPVPPVPRWTPRRAPKPDQPADDRDMPFAGAVTEPEAAPPPAPPPAPTLSPETLAPPQPALAPPAPTAVLDKSVLPPTARRRPSTTRSPAELRQAVAGAVARAAAQGPLIPAGNRRNGRREASGFGTLGDVAGQSPSGNSTPRDALRACPRPSSPRLGRNRSRPSPRGAPAPPTPERRRLTPTRILPG